MERVRPKVRQMSAPRLASASPAPISNAAPAVIVPSLASASLTISVNLLIDNLPQKIRDRDA